MADDTSAGGSSSSAAGSSPAPSTATASTTAVSTPASATATPATGSTAATTTERGPIPYDRHESILHGAYSERDAAKKATEELRTKYGWADQFQAEPVSFVENWMDKLAEHPQYGQQILAKAARMLASRRGQMQPVAAPEKPKPDVPIQDEHGRVVGMAYSADQQEKLDAFNWQQREAKLNERFAPFEKQREEQEQQAFVQQIRDLSDQSARSTLTELRQNPYFKEHEAKVKAALAGNEAWGDNIHAAFNHVLVTDILPNLSHTEQRKVVESLQLKAGAGGVNPGGQTATQKPKFASFEQAAQYYAEHPDEAAAMAKR